MPASKTLSMEVVRILQQRGLSLRKIGQIADIHPSEVTRIKAGEREWRTSQFIQIAKYLNIPAGGLMQLALREIEDRATWKKRVCSLIDDLNSEMLQFLHSPTPRKKAA
jgi:transcriptional regulator with XRE-family HTH domain